MRFFNYAAFATVAVSCLQPVLPAVAEPYWWSSPVPIWESSPLDVANWAPINVGQLKHVATQAKAHLDSQLYAWGKAGTAVNNTCNFSATGNYAPVNVGQLKNVASVFYDRLRRYAYNWQNPGTTGTLPLQRYPWTGTIDAENSAPGNVGQLKNMFNFELTYEFLVDSDWDNLPDGWEVAHFGNDTATAGTTDADSDGLTDYQEFEKGGSPFSADTDSDGISDSVTVLFGYELDYQDFDGDTLDAAGELARGTHPFMADTDHDGVNDAMDPLPLDPAVWAITGTGAVTGYPVLTVTLPFGAILVP